MPSSHPSHRSRLRLPAVTLSTVALVAAPTVVAGMPLGGSPARGHDRAGSVHAVRLDHLDAAGAREPGAVRHVARPAQQRSLRTTGTATTPAATAAPTSPASTTTTSAVTPVLAVPGEVAVVGATWPRSAHLGTGSQMQVRTRTDGRWGAWQALDADAEHGPDTTGPGAAEARSARAGTEPYVVTGADAVQVRVDGGAPAASTQVEVVDPGDRAADPTVGVSRPDAAAAAVARPTIYSRKAWGADESLRKGTVEYGSVQVGFVHHTAGTNSYTAAQVPAIIRGIYSFHVKGRGWNDIGYNFLVDRFGRVWEGRYGGVDLPVVGAHTQGYNSQAFAMSALGNFDQVRPSSAMVDAYSRLFAWKMSLHGIPATGSVVVNGHTFQRISGHRDAGQTSCPGIYLYGQLGRIRSATAARMGSYPRVGVTRSLDGGGSPDVLAAAGGGATPLVLPETVSPVAARRQVGRGWQALRAVTVSPDLTGDGHPDVVAIESSQGVRVYRGTGRGGFVSGYAVKGRGWDAITRIIAPGDLTGDGRNDLLALDTAGTLRLYAGDGRGWVQPYTVLGKGWQGIRNVVGAGDLTGDGVPDLVGTRASTGELFRYAGTGTGGIRSPQVIGTGWGGFTLAAAGSDLDGDGAPDIEVREPSGRMRTYYGSAGRFSQRTTWGSGFQQARSLTGGVDWDGDGHPDVMGQMSDGGLYLYPGTGRREYDHASSSGVGLTGTDVSFVVGDLDHDGISSVVARDRSSGDLYLYREPGTGSASATRVRIGSGWQYYDLVGPAGDLDGDGVPDVVARQRSTGTLYVYPMRASGGFGPRRVLATGWQSATDVVGVGTWDGDGAPDLVARFSDGSLRLYRGNGPGRLLGYQALTRTSPNAVALVGAGDVDGDGRADLIARGQDGRVNSYADAAGRLAPRRVLVSDPRAAGAPLG